MIPLGTRAPSVRLPDQFGTPWSLADALGRRHHALLLFFPGAHTFVCSSEIPALDHLAARFLAEANTEVVAIGPDSAESMRAWCAQQLDGIRVPVLSDFHPRGAVGRAYGAWVDDLGRDARATVIVGRDGAVRYASTVPLDSTRDLDALLREAQRIDGDLPRPAQYARPAALPHVVRRATLYVAKGCGHCRHVLDVLTNLRAQAHVAVKDIAKDAAAYKEFVRHQFAGTPALVVEATAHGGAVERVVGRPEVTAKLLELYR